MTKKIDAGKPSQTSHEITGATPEHKQLNIFIGKWDIQGKQHAGLVGAEAKIIAVETFKWLTGGFFLVHRFEGHVGDSRAACIEMIGYEAKTQSYAVQTFYDNGIANQWQMQRNDRTWTLSGKWKMPDKLIKVRCTMVFDSSGDQRSTKWEYLLDGSKWETFWDVMAKKVM